MSIVSSANSWKYQIDHRITEGERRYVTGWGLNHRHTFGQEITQPILKYAAQFYNHLISLDKKVKLLQKALKDKEGEIQEQKKKLTVNEDELKTKKTQNQNKYHLLRGIFNQLGCDDRGDIQAYQYTIDRIRYYKQKQRQQFHKFVDKNKIASREFNELQEQVIEGYQQQVQDLQEEVSELRTQVNEWKMKYESLKNSIPKMKKEDQDEIKRWKIKHEQMLSKVKQLQISLVNEQLGKQFRQVKENKFRNQIDELMKQLQVSDKYYEKFYSNIHYKFSQQLKNTDLDLISETTVKANQSGKYNFALLGPSIQARGDKPFKVGFKIKQYGYNWLAVGVCYKSLIQCNLWTNGGQYQPGHGAYLLSSNGNTWSHHDQDKNNKSSEFSYEKGDIVTISYNPEYASITFGKQGKKNKGLTLNMEVRQGDDLHLCVVLYYFGDQIQFVGHVEEKIDYEFSNELKNDGVQSSLKSTYNFALIQPSIQLQKQVCQFGFRIKQMTSKWLAIGICYRSVLADNLWSNNNQYKLGHGAYLVSCNGNSWSTTNSNKNNHILAFPYGKGDVISLAFDLQLKMLVLKKEGTEQFYVHEIQTKKNDELHLCVLFENPGDEIQFLGKYKPKQEIQTELLFTEKAE